MKNDKLKENMQALWKLCHHLDISIKNDLANSVIPLKYKNAMECNNIPKNDIRKIIFSVFDYFYANSIKIDSFYFDINKIKFNAPEWVIKEAFDKVCQIIILLYGALFFSSELTAENYDPIPKIYKCIAERLHYQLWKL